MRGRSFLLSRLLLAASMAWAVNVQASVQVVGVFPGSAVLLIDGQRKLVKVGQDVKGIKLESVSGEQAVITSNGERKTLSLSQEQTKEYKPPEKTVVQLVRNNDGHYWTTGQINGRTVRMIVDTGASDISINETEAKRLGLSYR